MTRDAPSLSIGRMLLVHGMVLDSVSLTDRQKEQISHQKELYMSDAEPTLLTHTDDCAAPPRTQDAPENNAPLAMEGIVYLSDPAVIRLTTSLEVH